MGEREGEWENAQSCKFSLPKTPQQSKKTTQKNDENNDVLGFKTKRMKEL